MFKLVIQDDEGKTTVVPLIRDEITIGRKEGNTIRLTERNVSRRHARILRNNGEVHIEDLNSYNGIRVNNARIAERVSLRVSDQVQIGDYKLYLKAEGLEQVDESHTIPVERQSQVPTTEAMSAVVPAVTAPQPIQSPPPGTLIGNPAHTMVALGDTDPAGRTISVPSAPPIVDSAVAHAGVTAASGYGRLVVLSSNFAGREFDLSRAQMIIGRTEENDIVVNHRSISRNHAKLVREPETGRYTISDLQSSNGVRVNGQDYGKVELRRGDVIDLGHVRLRFIEPGEDFVFTRDAVITDVPDSSSRRGLVFAVLAAIVVLGAGVAIYTTMMRGGGDNPPSGVVAPNPGPGTNGAITVDGGDVVAVDNSGSADNSGSETVPPKPNPTVAVPTRPDGRDDQNGDCASLQVQHKWQELRNCAAKLDALGSKDKAKDYTDVAVREQQNELVAADVQQLLREKNLKDAQTKLGKIGVDSVYAVPLRDSFVKAENAAIDQATRKANSFAAAHDCASFHTEYKQLTQSSTPRVAAAIASIKCIDKNGNTGTEVATTKPATGSGGTSTTAPAPADPAAKAGCDGVNVDDLISQAASNYSSGFRPTALALINKALSCKQNDKMYRLGAMYACAAHDLATAKSYYVKITPTNQPGIVQRCLQEQLDPRPQPQ